MKCGLDHFEPVDRVRRSATRERDAALPPSPARTAADLRIAGLLEAAARDPDRIARFARPACAQPGVWFDDIARLADCVQKELA